MSNKKIIILISIIVTIIVVAVASALIIHKNKSNTKTVANINDNKYLKTEEPIDEPSNEPTEKPIDTPKPISSPLPQANVVKGKYYIKVNNKLNVVTIYTKDESGNYTVPVKAMICSTGENTPQNSTYIINGKRWEWKELFGNVYGQYTTHIDRNILFHSVPYTTNKKKDSLEYWEYDKLGTTCSLGCVRLKVEDAKWIYDNCLAGTIVEFYSSNDGGPLGKPSAIKISKYEKYRNWDPTDPDENNPWKNLTNQY